MEGFFLLLGHLVGDYVVQNDWQAANKTNPHPGQKPRWSAGAPHPTDLAEFRKWLDERNAAAAAGEWDGWENRRAAWLRGHLACTVHCLLYTLAVWLTSFLWMPWWGLVLCFVSHWVIDRFRLARWWMDNVSGQKIFAEKMAPWSVIVIDNIFHLMTLGLIAVLAGRVTPT